MEHTKLPLTIWFLAIYLIGQAKSGLSSLALKRQVGVRSPSAWLLLQKIKRAMVQQEQTPHLEGEVQFDDAYLGGERSDGKAGRGSENKESFAAAGYLKKAVRPRYIRLGVIRGFTSDVIAKWATGNLALGSIVASDGLRCFGTLAAATCMHVPGVVGRRKPSELPQLAWVNTKLGNIKTKLTHSHHGLDSGSYAQHMRIAFAHRFNRRFDLCGMVGRLVVGSWSVS